MVQRPSDMAVSVLTDWAGISTVGYLDDSSLGMGILALSFLNESN